MALTASVKTLREAWHLMNGVVCIYKPAESSYSRVRQGLIANICRDMKQFEPSDPRTYVKIERVPDTERESYELQCQPNFADFDLVRGPAIEPQDVRVGIINKLGTRASGVMLAVINDGNKRMKNMIINRPLTVYQIKGQFGFATDTHWYDGKVWEKTTIFHLTKGKIDRVLSSIEASHQRKMFEYCRVDPNSQTAYELASQGMLRPAVNGPPVIYSIKCLEYQPPHFTLEIHCINEDSTYLATLIHDLGIALKTTSVCHQMRCIRFGHFSLDHALLRKHWSFEYFVPNMQQCKEILDSMPYVKPILSSVNNTLNQANRKLL